MARRKLNAFTADEAGDHFTPTVKKMHLATESDTPVVKPKVKKEKDTPKPVDEKKTSPPPKEKKVIQPTKSVSPPAPPKAAASTEAAVSPQRVEKVTPPPKPKPVKEEPTRRDEKVMAEIAGARSQDVKDRHAEKVVQLVGFYLGEEEFGVDIQNIREINRMVDITRVPRTPDFVVGVINLRGNVIPVINMRKRFGLPEKDSDKSTRIVVVEVYNKTIGILVDGVSEVLRIPAGIIEPPPDIVSGIHTKYIEGVAKLQDRLLILLNLEKVLTSGEAGEMDEAA